MILELFPRACPLFVARSSYVHLKRYGGKYQAPGVRLSRVLSADCRASGWSEGVRGCTRNYTCRAPPSDSTAKSYGGCTQGGTAPWPRYVNRRTNVRDGQRST